MGKWKLRKEKIKGLWTWQSKAKWHLKWSCGAVEIKWWWMSKWSMWSMCKVKPNGKVQIGKVKHTTKLMMQAGEPPFQKCAFSNLPLSSYFVHFLSLLHFCKASKMCMMSWGKHFWWVFTLGEPTPLKLIGPPSYKLRLAQEVLTMGAHYLQKLPCHRFGLSLHGLEMNHFIYFSFHFHFF